MKRPAQICITCGRITHNGAYCTTHQQARTRQRNNTPQQRAYRTTEYQRARIQTLSRYPQCHLDTATPPCNGHLTVHHLNHDNTDNRLENLATICMTHHMLLEQEHRRGETTGPLHTILTHAVRSRS
jgi:hypothetical protein